MMPTGTPFWHNPCGMQLAAFDGSGGGAGFGSGSGGHDVMMMESDAVRREEDIIPSVVMSANQALIHVEQFAGSFVSTPNLTCFKSDFYVLFVRTVA